MPNRYVRDQLVLIALDMAQLPNLTVHDAPNGVVQQHAFAIQWLQDILDYWYHMCPFSATVVKQPMSLTANTDTVTLPDDFILDVRNGLLVQTTPGDNTSYRRRFRVPLQKFINRQVVYQKSTHINYPDFYCVVGDDGNIMTQHQTMKVTPTPSINTQCQLWYYQLPAVLKANQKPKFPNDYCCVEYLRIRAHEWQGLYEPGTAQKFCDKIVSSMKASGLFNEPEDDEIPFDEQSYRKTDSNGNPFSWMGSR